MIQVYIGRLMLRSKKAEEDEGDEVELSDWDRPDPGTRSKRLSFILDITTNPRTSLTERGLVSARRGRSSRPPSWCRRNTAVVV